MFSDSWKKKVRLKLFGTKLNDTLILTNSLSQKLLALLALADLFTSIGVLDLGLMRKGLFTTVMETSRVPIEVAFTKSYTTYVYLADVLGFVIALLVNCITLCRLGHLYSQRENRFEVKKQVRRIHYLLLISIISTLTVAIPNGISLVSAWFGRDFRQRVYEILGCLSIDDWQDKGRVLGDTARNGNDEDQLPKQTNKNNNNNMPLNNLGKSITNADNLVSDSVINPKEKQKSENARKAWTTNSKFHFDSLDHI
uniref:G_PROTEIN_RECEP_F1_2 domain-containing protein n=1 Tax=Meloidogyne javanica TaxID=6303 RepID=A0A915LNI8_MELJA